MVALWNKLTTARKLKVQAEDSSLIYTTAERGKQGPS